VIDIKDALKRIARIEQLLQNNADYTLVIAFNNLTDNNYLIWHYIKGDKTEYLYDKIEDFIRDKKINTKDKNTIIKIFKVSKNREQLLTD
jgi:hypothetical protein